MSKDDSGIQYLQKGGFRARTHGDAQLMSSSCRMALWWFQTIRRERFIESAIESSSKKILSISVIQIHSRELLYGRTRERGHAA
jgi:hypothetical protein